MNTNITLPTYLISEAPGMLNFKPIDLSKNGTDMLNTAMGENYRFTALLSDHCTKLKDGGIYYGGKALEAITDSAKYLPLLASYALPVLGVGACLYGVYWLHKRQIKPLEEGLKKAENQLKVVNDEHNVSIKKINDELETQKNAAKEAKVGFEKKLKEALDKNASEHEAQINENRRLADEKLDKAREKASKDAEDEMLKVDQNRAELQRQLDENKEQLQKLLEKIERKCVRRSSDNNYGKRIPDYNFKGHKYQGQRQGYGQGTIIVVPIIQPLVTMSMIQTAYCYPAFGYCW